VISNKLDCEESFVTGGRKKGEEGKRGGRKKGRKQGEANKVKKGIGFMYLSVRKLIYF